MYSPPYFNTQINTWPRTLQLANTHVKWKPVAVTAYCITPPVWDEWQCAQSICKSMLAFNLFVLPSVWIHRLNSKSASERMLFLHSALKSSRTWTVALTLPRNSTGACEVIFQQRDTMRKLLFSKSPLASSLLLWAHAAILDFMAKLCKLVHSQRFGNSKGDLIALPLQRDKSSHCSDS